MDPNAAVYYFSGSGNSLAVARDIAAGCGGVLTAMASITDGESVIREVDTIGIVFPVYHGGLPNIVSRFLEKMGGLEKSTYSGSVPTEATPLWP